MASLKSQPGSPVVKVAGLSKAYKTPNGRIQILDDFNLAVQPGNFVTITGPSGSGKTTLLALLGALDKPDAGEIWIDGVPVHQLYGPRAADFRREKIGFVFQSFYLLPNLTAIENVMAPLLPYRRHLQFDLKQRALELLERVGLAQRLGHAPARLSGGEQQRVAIARALINSPTVLLADEPTGNLDPTTGMEVMGLLSELQQTKNLTLVVVTHDPQIAAIADSQFHLTPIAVHKTTE